MAAKTKSYSLDTVRDDAILFAAFDTETRGLGGELLAISAHVMGETFYYAGPDMLDQFLELFLSYPAPVVWYAHNAQYDWRYIIPHLIKREYTVQLNMRTETDIYQCVVLLDKKKYTMRDSWALVPSSLDDMLCTFCPELPKLKIDVENFDPVNPEHIAYAKRDAEGLAKALPRADTMLRDLFGVGVGHTTAGTAVKAWCNTLAPGEYHRCSTYDAREQFIREAYYGGLVFLTRDDKLESLDDNPAAETYDVNSSYPSVMRDFGVPSGRMVESSDYLSGLMGIYRVRVSSPDDLVIPMLPCRNIKGHMQWRRGTFDTIVTSAELIFAANHGYKILDLYEGFAFEETIFPFDTFIKRCQSIRRDFKKQPQEALAKLMQNSLYGKFGSRRERLKIYHPESDDDMLEGMPLENLDYFWVKKELDEAMRCIPQWAVFITAHARLKILQAVYSVGVENALYGDTDSVTVLYGHAQSINVGDDYGQFKLEKQWRTFRAIAPKVYTGTLMDGTPLGAIKGIPKKAMRENPQKWAELYETGATQASALSLASLRVALSKGTEPARTLSRVSTNIKNSSNWTSQNGRVSPKIAA